MSSSIPATDAYALVGQIVWVQAQQRPAFTDKMRTFPINVRC